MYCQRLTQYCFPTYALIYVHHNTSTMYMFLGDEYKQILHATGKHNYVRRL